MVKECLLKIYSCIRKLWDRPNLNEIPNELIKLDIDKYCEFINKYPYKWDKLHGLLDNTESISHFLDESVKSNRDCDDFARMWSAWLVHNGYDAIEVIITDPNKFFNKSHFITIGKRDNDFILLNYKNHGPFSSFEAAIDYMRIFGSYMNGYIYTIYRKFNKLN